MSEINQAWVSFAGSLVEVTWSGELAQTVIMFLLGNHLSFDDPQKEAHSYVHVQPGKQHGYLLVYREEELVFQGNDLPQVADVISAVINRELAWHSSGGILLHSAALSGDKGVVIIPGYPGAGKSTLTAWLLEKGMLYLTDELVFWDSDQKRLSFFARPIQLSAHSMHALKLSPDQESMLCGESFCLLAPRKLADMKQMQDHNRLCCALFPRYMGGDLNFKDVVIDPVGKAQVGLELMKVLVNARNVEGKGFSQAAFLARGISGYRLKYSSFDQIEPFLKEELGL